MGYDRHWLDEPHLGDHVSRSVWALGEIFSPAWVPAVAGPTERLLNTIVHLLPDEVSLRTGAYAALGLAHLDADRRNPEAQRLLERVMEQLSEAYAATAGEDWLWFEDALTYDNARLPQALIVGASPSAETI